MTQNTELAQLRRALSLGSSSVLVSASTLHLLILALDTLDDIHRRASMVVGLQGLGLTFVSEPAHWTWWALGRTGDACTLAEAMAQAEGELERRAV